MKSLAQLGRYFFAIPFGVFGIQYFLYGHYAGGLPPVPPWAPGGAVGAYLIGAFLVIAAISVLANWNARLFAALLGLVYLLCVLLLHSQHFSDIIYNGRERTRALEPLSLSGAAFVLAGRSPSTAASASWNSLIDKLATLGRYLFSLPLLIYGLQHFLYASFIATLIPAWMPARLFLAYFTGVAFIAAGLSITSGIAARLACFFLGLMFFLWTVLLHAPRVVSHLNNGDEWSSAFVALAMAGASFLLLPSFSERT